MNIQALLSAGQNITVSVTPADLKEFALVIIDRYKATAEAEALRRRNDRRMTGTEAAKYLGKSLATLWRWQKAGLLVPDGRIGQQPFFFQSTLDNFGRKDAAL